MFKPTTPFKNAVFDTTFKGLQAIEPLKPKEYDKVFAIIKATKVFDKPIKFDEQTDIIFCKIPETEKAFREIKNKDGEVTGFGISVITPDSEGNPIWWSFAVNTKEDQNDLYTHQGCRLAVVGKMTEKEGTEDKDGKKKVFKNIVKYRGCVLLDTPKVVVDKSIPENSEDTSDIDVSKL